MERLMKSLGHAPQSRMSDDVLQQYARRTAKRPLLCFLALAALPFAQEIVMQILERL